jgi:fructokinase
MGDGNEENLRRVLASAPEARRLCDLNLRTGLWDLALVERLSQLATVMKMNDDEAERLAGMTLGGEFSLEGFCRTWSKRFGLEAICVTLGSKGCAVFAQDRLESFPGFKIEVVDTVGAGDAFTAAFVHGLHRGWPMREIARFANSVGAIVASRAGATPAWTVEECRRLMATGAERADGRAEA